MRRGEVSDPFAVIEVSVLVCFASRVCDGQRRDDSGFETRPAGGMCPRGGFVPSANTCSSGQLELGVNMSVIGCLRAL